MSVRPTIELAADLHRLDQTIIGEQVIVVELAGESYGIPITTVQEVEQVPPITRVPHAASWIRGVVNLRGAILTIIDPAELLGIGQWLPTPLARMLVAGGDDPVALAVDRMRGMRRLSESVDPDVLTEMPGRVSEFLTNVYRLDDAYLTALDIPALLAEANASSGSPVHEPAISTPAPMRAGGLVHGVSVVERGA